MQLVFLGIIIIVLLIVLGVPAMPLIRGALRLLEGFSVLCELFFLVSFVLLLFTKRRRAHFLRMDEEEERIGNYAVYEVDGVEYVNTFPTELMWEKLLYKKDSTVLRILSFRKRKLVFDRVSVGIVGSGLAAFTGILVVFMKIFG